MPRIASLTLALLLLTTPALAHDDPADGADLRRAAAQLLTWREPHPPAPASEWQQVKLLGINDFHGALSPRKLGTSDVGGAAVLAAYLKKAAAEASGPAFVVHAGDLVGASPPSSALLQDEPSIAFMNLLSNVHCGPLRRLDPRCNVAGTLGNHEFDEGKTEMFRLLFGGNSPKGPFLDDPWRGAVFPTVSANVVDADSGLPVLPPFVVKQVSPQVRFAIIGAVLEGTPAIVTAAGVAGFAFRDEAASINQWVPIIRALGIRTIVVAIHQGGFQTNNTQGGPGPATALDGPELKDIVSRLDGEIDVVISGHTHSFTNTLLPNAAGKPVLVTQAFSSGTAYADIDLAIDPRTKEVMSKQAKVVTTYHKDLSGAPLVTPDAQVAALVAAADARVAPIVNEVIGAAGRAVTTSQNAAGESEMGDLIADAQRWKTGVDFAFMNPGGVRAGLEAGTITWGALFTAQPFANDLVTMTMTGQQVRDVLAQQFVAGRILQLSGLKLTWRAGAGGGVAGGALVDVVTSDGVKLDEAATYTVVANSFLAGGGDGFGGFQAGANREVGPVDLDALVDYVRQLAQPVVVGVEGRDVIVP